MRSIKLKLVFLYLALVFIVMLVSGTFMIVSIRMQEIERLKTELTEFSNQIYGEILANPNKREADYGDELSNLFRAGPTRLNAKILNKDGYNLDQEQGPGVQKSTAITGAMLGKPTFEPLGWGFGAQNETMGYAMPYPYNSRVNLTVQNIIYVEISTDTMYKRLADVTATVVLAVLIALTLTFVIGILFAQTLTGPIVMLTKQAITLAKGDLSRVISVKSNDEIGQLTETFNEMAIELSHTLENISTEKNKMEILLYNMTDGVLAYDRQGELIDANYPAREQLGINDMEEMNFFEMARAVDLEIEDFDIEKLQNIKDTTVSVGDKYISMIFSPYYNIYGQTDGVVIVLHDITKHKKLDDERKEFVANVSHEIRTPLTTIKSYTETLLDGDIEDRELMEKFLSVIDKEADRMTLLIKDLLELSRFDNKQYALQTKVSCLNEIIGNSCSHIKVLAEKKNQTINFVRPEVEYTVNVDSDRINQVFDNILSNAVKYSPEDTEITIFIDRSDRFYRVYIKDQGVGIPKGDLLRIFERFYRADKARSREMGGTGLGLAISKEIMEAHGFRISANSELGKGTTMILRFDKYRQ